MGATVHLWSDNTPYTIVSISKSGHKLILQEDKYRRLDGNGMSEVQKYVFQPDPDGAKISATKRKDGYYRVSKSNSFVVIGQRRRYYDYSF